MYICIYVCTYIRIYVYIHIHTYIYTPKLMLLICLKVQKIYKCFSFLKNCQTSQKQNENDKSGGLSSKHVGGKELLQSCDRVAKELRRSHSSARDFLRIMSCAAALNHSCNVSRRLFAS